MTDKKLSQEELRDLYRDDFVTYFKGTVYTLERLKRLLPCFDLKSDMTILDIGCGDGLLLGLIHDKIDFYYGVDFSSEMIEEAQIRQEQAGISNGQFHAESVIDFCERGEVGIDRAFALDFTEHVYDEDLLAIFKSVRRSLNPDGRLYLYTPNLTYFLEIMKARGILTQLHGHIAVRNERHYLDLLEKAGFKDVKVRFISHYNPILTPLHILSYLPFVGKYFQARIVIDCGA